MTMTTLGMCWWIAALVVMAVGAVDSLTRAEEKAVALVRENFHKTNKNKHVFQVAKILSNLSEKQFEETFVKVKFTMKRTNCKKHKWMNQYCAPIMTTKRTYNCLGCFIFNSSGDVHWTGYQKCVRQSRANKEEVIKKRREACAKLEAKPPLIGSYSFQRNKEQKILISCPDYLPLTPTLFTMNTSVIIWWMISVLVIVSSEAQSSTNNFSESQNRTMKLIMEHFHKKDHIRNGFKVSNVIKAVEIDYSSGVFVNLELELKQTICQKSIWTKTDCGLVKNGRTFNCFACFKFSYHSDKILSQLLDCVNTHQADAQRTKRRNQSCSEVEMKEGFDKPGSYGFLKSN